LLRLIILLISRELSTTEQLRDAETFFSKQETKTFNQVLGQKLEKIHAKIAWTQCDATLVKQWLKMQGHIDSKPEN
jgi:hypothetical protein